MKNLTILNTPIRTLDNLYSLNDLHIASGNNPNHRPNQFIRLETTKALAKAIEAENSNAQICAFKTLRGMNGGTYACQELVIAYAAWISAAFHLKVIRAFMTMNGIGSQPQQMALPQPEYHLSTIQNSEETLALLIKLYSFCYQAHEMQEKLSKAGLAKQIENAIGGQYLYNFKFPLEQTMAKAKTYIQSNTERLSLVKAMEHLLN